MENMVLLTILLVISNIMTLLANKTFYQKAKSIFFEFCDIPIAIKNAWQDDVITTDEIVTVAKESNDFIKEIKGVK